MPTGKDFADIVFIPFKDKEAESVIQQIKEKKYPQSLENYLDNIIISRDHL